MNKINRIQLKAEAKKLYHNNWSIAIKLNAVLSTIYMLILWGGAFIFNLIIWISTANNTEINQALSNSPNSSNGWGWLLSMLIAFITISISYTTLNWWRNKNKALPKYPGQSMFAIFNKSYLLGNLVIYILTTIFTFLWTLLLIVPGIIKRYSYSQAFLIYKDVNDNHHEDSINYYDCIQLSRQLMKGHKWELFVLQLSFLGWDILACLSLGIGFFWLVPYQMATYVGFYQKLLENDQQSTQPISDTFLKTTR